MRAERTGGTIFGQHRRGEFRPNQALETMSLRVTPSAGAEAAPRKGMSHLERQAKMRNYRSILRKLSIVCVAASLAIFVYVAVRKTPYQRFLDIRIGDEFSVVLSQLGSPMDRHQLTDGTDYLFSVAGDPAYPKLLGVPFPTHRIIRVKGGRVVEKGRYEDYYDPHLPGWNSVTKPSPLLNASTRQRQMMTISDPPNQALEPTSLRVTPRADARVAPRKDVAHLERQAYEKYGILASSDQ